MTGLTDNPIRSDARFPIKEELVRIRSSLPGAKLMDLSKTGVFIHTLEPDGLDVGDEAGFTLEFSFVTRQKSLDLRANVIRKTPKGFGFLLVFENDTEKQAWVDIVQEYDSYLRKSRSNQWRTALPNPIKITITMGGATTLGWLKEIGEEYALITATNIDILQPAELTFPGLRIHESKPSMLKARVLNFSVDGYVFQFFDLTMDQKKIVQSLVHSSYEAEPEPKEATVTHKMELVADKFVEIYERQISQGVLLIDKMPGAEIGQKTSALLIVKRNRKSSFRLYVTGEIVRETLNQKKVLKINTDGNDALQRAQRMVAEIQKSGEAKIYRGGFDVRKAMVVIALLIAAFLAQKLVSLALNSRTQPVGDAEVGLTVEQIVRFKFVKHLKWEDKEITVPSEPVVVFKLSDLEMVKYDPVSMKYFLVLSDKREVVVTKEFPAHLPEALLNIMKTLNPGDPLLETDKIE